MNKKKKILLVSCRGFGKAGVQAVIMSIVRSLSDEFSFDVLLFTDKKGYYDEEFLSYGGKILRLPQYNGSNHFRRGIDMLLLRSIRFYFGTRKILRENGPYQAIHANKGFESGILIHAAAKENVPVRIVQSLAEITKSNYLPLRWLEEIWQKQITNEATVKMCCSDRCGCMLFGEGASYCKLVNPYDDNIFRKADYPECVPQEPVLLQVARFDDNKNQLFTLEVFRHILKKYPDAKLRFVGFSMDDYAARLDEEIKACGLEKSVAVYPADADVPNLLSTSSAFLLPSKSEGFGIVLIEAQAMGVRCYASDAVPKTTNAGGVTYLSLSDGAEKWAETIIADYEKTGGKHEDYDCTKFSQKQVMNTYRRIYLGEQV